MASNPKRNKKPPAAPGASATASPAVAGEPEASRPVAGRASSQVGNLVLGLATAGGLYLCWLLTAPFFEALTWAVGLAVLFAPLQQRLENRLRAPSLAAFLAVAIISLIVLVPAAFVVQRLVLQVVHGATLLSQKVQSGEWQQTLEAKARLSPIFVQLEKNLDLPGLVGTLAGWLSGTAGAIVQGSVYQVVGFGLTLYLLFFLLRDRAAALGWLRSLAPLAPPEMDRLLGRLADTIRATVYGTLMVSAAQGFLGGLMFWFLGLPTPLLWGVVMALLAVVPVLGAFVVWLPAALFLASEGYWGKALILTIWGMLVVGSVDNLLRPMLVGKKLAQHTLAAFMSVVGGLMLFGPSGLILGPLVLTTTAVLLEIWAARRRETEPP